MNKIDLENMIEEQLNAMSKTIGKAYENKEDNNPFRPFDTSTHITEYMSLGRSFDSQLGNRLQSICIWVARESDKFECVPDYIFMHIDKKNDKIEIFNYTFPNDFRNKYMIGVTIKQYCGQVKNKVEAENKVKEDMYEYIKKQYIIDNSLKSIRGKNPAKEKHSDCVERLRNTEFLSVINKDYKYSSVGKNKLKKAEDFGESLDIDLIYFKSKNNVIAYEIKASGNLDTNNGGANKNKVQKFEDVFSFVSSAHARFAACYNNNGEGTSTRIINKNGVHYRGNYPTGSIFNNNEIDIYVGSAFFEEIMPNSITYADFIDAYEKAFKDSDLNEFVTNI